MHCMCPQHANLSVWPKSWLPASRCPHVRSRVKHVSPSTAWRSTVLPTLAGAATCHETLKQCVLRQAAEGCVLVVL